MDQTQRKLLITGGAGFIGSTLVRQCLSAGYAVVTFDKLTYAGHRESLAEVLDHPRHDFVVGDIADVAQLEDVFVRYRPSAVIHLAAESHVDRSIASPPQFATTNVLGTCVLLDVTTQYWLRLPRDEQTTFRLLNISTDEVFGSAAAGEFFSEHSPFAPNSPYAASKAAGEHFTRAFAHTYGLPVVTVNPSNNYGPRQHPEKFVPKMILAALNSEPLGLYGDGLYERDWLHVDDCCRAILEVLATGIVGERYLVGANNCLPNVRVAELVCDMVDELLGDGGRRRTLITRVSDRPGHDRRYALDSSHLKAQTEWRPTRDSANGLRETVRWYAEHPEWVAAVLN